MSAISRDKISEKSKRRANEISEYISKHPESKQAKPHTALVKGIQKELVVYELPRHLLRLNPNNWRFKAEFNVIKETRRKQNKPLELDSDDEEDKKTIRELLRGINPNSVQRKERYKELKKDFIMNSKNGGNGQTTPGLILYDGTYINGNRRDTILDDLSKNPPEGCQPTQFQTIKVALLPKNITTIDIKANETKEQISLDSRERYDYTNGALMVADYMQHLVKIKKLTEKAAIKEIANQVFGLNESNIQEYLDFKKTADDFLKTIGKPGQYNYIQDGGGEKDEGGIVQILKEIGEQKQKIRKLQRSPTKASKLIKSLYAFAWYSKEKPKARDDSGKLKPMNFNHRAFRNFKKDAFASDTAMDKLLESGTVDKIDWNQPQDHAQAFYTDIYRATSFTSTSKSNLQPLFLLEDAAEKISHVNKSMKGPRGSEVQAQVRQKGLDYIKRIQSNISDISKKINKHTGKR